MAEYKNGVNYRGNMSVYKDRASSDVHTGRAVFVDEDKYSDDAEYKAKVDKCLAEGFHRVGNSEGGGDGGSASDFNNVNITLKVTGGEHFHDTFLIQFTDFVNGSINGCQVAEEDGRRFFKEDDQIEVEYDDYPDGMVYTAYLYRGGPIMVGCSSCVSLSDYTVSGAAEAKAIVVDGVTIDVVEVTGDCIISVLGGWK